MPVERRRHANLHIFIDARQAAHDVGQITLQMDAQRQEIGDHDDAGCSLRDGRLYCAGEIRPPLLEEGGFHDFERGFLPDAGGKTPDRIICGFDTRSMGKNDDRGHGYD